MTDNVVKFPKGKLVSSNIQVSDLYEDARRIADEKGYEHVIIVAGNDSFMSNIITYGFINEVHQRDALNQATHLTYLAEQLQEEDSSA